MSILLVISASPYHSANAQTQAENSDNRLSSHFRASCNKANRHSPCPIAWEYSRYGGGGGTEVYEIGSDDEMCRDVRAYMNKVVRTLRQRTGKVKLIADSCASQVRFFPQFSEPPWKELKANDHKALVGRLLRYKDEGARQYFDFVPAPYRKSEEYYDGLARQFIRDGGRLQYWETRLVDFSADPRDLVDKQLSAGKQNVIQLRYVVKAFQDDKKSARDSSVLCEVPSWRGYTFLVTKELDGPDPRVFDGGAAGALSSSTMFVYKGRPVLLDDDSSTISIKENRDSTFILPVCDLTRSH